ncbi:hypothetical protein Bbelb_030540 [Branchiostoma belcheri]|nr:hypothetical protein Bbelb_030540 [Branchiostoma belcheri]
MYPECFDNNVGRFKGEYHITIDPNVKPVVHQGEYHRLKVQLQEMVEEGIISEVTQPTSLYKFNRLPFGLKVSQDVFQREIDDAYRNCRGAIAMEITRAAGIKLNAEKCIVKKQECKFFGKIYPKDGVKPDPTKFEATKMKEPKDAKELRSFLGLIQYMTAFIPNLANHTPNMRELLKEDIEYKWSESHSKDFNGDNTAAAVLGCKPVTLQVDASMKGVGALLRLQHYDYTIKYKLGKDMLLADALSRLSPHDKKEIEYMKVQIHHIVRVTTTKLEEIRQETSKDQVLELQLLVEAVTQGWPQKRNEILQEIQGYWTIRDDILIEDVVLLAGSRIIIPKSMRPEILQKIHEGHLGMEKSKLRAKTAVYWVGLYKEIERMKQSCQLPNMPEVSKLTTKRRKDSNCNTQLTVEEARSRPVQGMDSLKDKCRQKKTLTKCVETGEDPNLALRTTPLRADMKSPAELLNGRKYKSTLLQTKKK